MCFFHKISEITSLTAGSKKSSTSLYKSILKLCLLVVSKRIFWYLTLSVKPKMEFLNKLDGWYNLAQSLSLALIVNPQVTPKPNRLPEQDMCITKPLSFHFSAHVNRLEQLHSLAAAHLEFQRVAYFFRVKCTVLSKDWEWKLTVGSHVDITPATSSFQPSILMTISVIYLTHKNIGICMLNSALFLSVEFLWTESLHLASYCETHVGLWCGKFSDLHGSVNINVKCYIIDGHDQRQIQCRKIGLAGSTTAAMLSVLVPNKCSSLVR